MRWAPGMAAALLLASLASHASALGPVSPAGTPDVVFNGKEGPKVLMAKDDATAAVTQQLLAALARSAEAFVKGTDVPAGPSIAAAAPANVSAATVASVMGSIMAASVFEVIASRTLGDPKFYPYNDGTGRVALYRFPKRRAKGTCIFVHGCKHDPYSWFYKTRGCPMCTGLPEEVSHTKQCLARGYAVLALMSLDRSYRFRCFSSSGGPDRNDQPSAGALVDRWMKTFKLSGKPKYMFGVSSGASFAIKFPMTMWVDGVVSEVNMPWEKAWGATDGRGRLRVRFPPTAYFMMQRDLQTKRQIEKGVQILRSNGVPSDYVYIPARQVTKDWLSMRSIYITPTQSRAIWAALIKARVIDRQGNVLYDVRVNRGWIKLLPKILPWLKRSDPYYNLISDESQIWQELNLAWSWHEIVSDPVQAVLAWLETGGRANLQSLVRRYDHGQFISCLTEHREGCGRGRRMMAQE